MKESALCSECGGGCDEGAPALTRETSTEDKFTGLANKLT